MLAYFLMIAAAAAGGAAESGIQPGNSAQALEQKVCSAETSTGSRVSRARKCQTKQEARADAKAAAETVTRENQRQKVCGRFGGAGC